MKNYFYNLNKKYLQAFKTKVLSRFSTEYIKTDEAFLKIIFREINDLFSRIGGRTANKRDIPKKGHYPDSDKHNRLINAINDDIEKLYKAQSIIEDDLNNLLKFNSKQRTSSFEDMTSTYQKIASIYIKNKKDISGEFVIKNDFQSQDSLSTDSNGVDIDETRGILTLASTFNESKPIDTDNVVIYFGGKKPLPPLYPNDDVLRPGAHWRIPDQSESHFIDSLNANTVRRYKQMMIDTPNINTGIGWTEYEAVYTELINHLEVINRTEYTFVDGGEVTKESFVPNIKTKYPNKSIWTLKQEVSKISGLNKDPEIICLDVPYSLQGTNGFVKRASSVVNETDQQEKYKLIIPFNNNTKITNEIAISFAPIEGDIPKIIWNESKVFSNQQEQDLSYPLVEPKEDNVQSQDGYYICRFNTYVQPSRLELILTYGGDPWHLIPFQMTHYTYSINRRYSLSQTTGNVSFLLSRNYDIFVDSEPNKDKEKSRAFNVLLGIKE